MIIVLPGNESSCIELLAYEPTSHRAESQLSTTPDTRVSLSDDFCRVVNKRLTDVEKLKALNKDWSHSESFKFPQTMFGKQKRSFQISWLTKYPGLVYSEQEDGAYCKFCVLFDCEAQKRGQLVKEPFRNWRKAVEKLNEHFNDHGISTKRGGNGYDLHSFCKLKAQEFLCMMSKQVTVETIMFKGLEERRSNNVKILESIVKTVLLCGRQNFALRGHRDDSRHIEEATSNVGNFQALLDYRIDGGDTLLAKHFQTAPRNATYRSKTIHNELITVMGEVIRNKIVTDIKSSGGWFCLSADEVQDVSNKEQLSITVRFADVKGNIREEFMAFEDVSGDTSGLNLSERLLLSLQKFELDPEKMRSQCYDGAGNMMGKLKGVGPRIQSQFPKAVPFWCTAHRLNRCIVAATNIQMVRNMMGFADKAASFFNDSTKRQKSLETQLDEVKSENLRMKLKALCRTRWVERHDAFEIFIELLPATVGALTSIQQHETRTDALADTTGLLHSITSFQFIICLVVVQQCLGYLKQLSIFLQGRAMDIVRAFHMVNNDKVALQEVRDEVDSYHSQWFQQAVNLAREVGTEPSVPRTCKKQTQRDNTESSCAEEYYRRTLTIPFVDHLNTELETRFSDLQQKASLGLLLLPSSAEHATELTDKLDYFSEDLPSPNTIKQEIHMWNLKWNNSSMMKPDTLEKALKECDQSFFPNINAILRICCVFPVTSAECERSISVLRLIKNYLRSTMGQERVSALCLMFIHRDINIDPTEVVTIFSQRNPRRMLLPDVLCDPR